MYKVLTDFPFLKIVYSPSCLKHYLKTKLDGSKERQPLGLVYAKAIR